MSDKNIPISRERKDLIKFSGMARTESGKLTRHNYFKFLRNDLDDYTDLDFTPEQAQKVHMHLLKMSTGSSAMIPIYCGGSVCPFKERCHPPGTLIATTNHGYVPIEELDPTIHKLLSFRTKHSLVLGKRDGYDFLKGSRKISGQLVEIRTETGKSLQATMDHIALVKWDIKAAQNKFCVYLMRKGNFWRIGKTFLFRKYKNTTYKGETQMFFGPQGRYQSEKADELWILGVYDTNTEAMLAEEKFSIRWGVSKSCFLVPNRKTPKWDGVYKWITQEQLDRHHESCTPTYQQMDEHLSRHGLDIGASLLNRYRHENLTSVKVGTTQAVRLRSSNILAKYMQVFNLEGQLETVELVKRIPYEGHVFSLEVEKYHTYIANDIVTHNCVFWEIGKAPLGKQCLTEVELMKQWIIDYMEEFDVDPQNFTEVAYANELAEIMIMERRLNMNLAKVENAELVIDQTVGVDREGDPILQKQISPFMELKDKLASRKSKVIKLMVGDRQEKYKKEAALKVKLDSDPSAKMAAMRTQLENLTRQLDNIEKVTEQPEGEERVTLSPEDIIDDPSE